MYLQMYKWSSHGVCKLRPKGHMQPSVGPGAAGRSAQQTSKKPQQIVIYAIKLQENRHRKFQRHDIWRFFVGGYEAFGRGENLKGTSNRVDFKAS